jgi:hypothetical protein
VHECPQCAGSVEEKFRFCPWCAAPQRRKLVEFFPAKAGLANDRGKALRVSRYLRERHVRFSVWNEGGVAEGAVSISDDEATRLARFLAADEAETQELPRVRRRSARRFAGSRRGA